jgi:hypothetical protein
MDCNMQNMPDQPNGETNLSNNLVLINNTKPWVGPRYNKKEDNQIYKFSQEHAPCSPQEFRRTNHQPTHPYCPRNTLVVKTTHVNRVRCCDLENSDSDKHTHINDGKEEKTKIQPPQLGTFYSLPLGKTSQTLTSLTLPFKNAQCGISTASTNLTNGTILTMQSTNTHWAGAETSVTKTSSTANRDQPQRVTITRNNMDCNMQNMPNQLNGETNLSNNLVPINNTKPWVGPWYNKKEDSQIYKFNQGHTPYSPQEFRRTNHQPIHGTYDPQQRQHFTPTSRWIYRDG